MTASSDASSPPEPAAGPERPVFIFSAGWRTGSTLLQRLLCSTPNILIWGENRGAFERFEQAARIIDGLQSLGRRHIEEYRRKGSMGWIAVMNPPADCFREGLCRLLETYYRDPARQLGRSRWGFKEVRHGRSAARFLADLYPEARFLLLVRHPEGCLASARATSPLGLADGLLDEVGGPEPFLRLWAELAADFHEDWGDVRRLALRYEDIVASPTEAIVEVADFLGEPRDSFDPGVFDVRRRGWLGLPPRLTRDDVALLRADWLWAAAGRWGYTPRRTEVVARPATAD